MNVRLFKPIYLRLIRSIPSTKINSSKYPDLIWKSKNNDKKAICQFFRIRKYNEIITKANSKTVS
jgi:hypothetical protein